MTIKLGACPWLDFGTGLWNNIYNTITIKILDFIYLKKFFKLILI